MAKTQRKSLFDPAILGPAIPAAFAKLDPRSMFRSPVMFVVEIIAALTTVLFLRDLFAGEQAWFSGQIALWLWITVLFANLAEAVAEGRGKAQADTLRRMRTEVVAKALILPDTGNNLYEPVRAHLLQPGQIVLVEAGDVIPSDGEVIEGVASVDESAITGESAPVIRESGGDRSAVTGPGCSPTGSRCGSPPPPAAPSSTA
jgi:K+-transporting ATPase ATPase B chain